MRRLSSLIFVLLLAIVGSWPATPLVSAQDDEADVQLFFTEDGSFSAALPDGWVGAGNRQDGLLVANSQATMDAVDAGLDPTGDQFIVAVIALDIATLELIGFTEDASIVDLAELIITTNLVDNGFTVSAVEEIELAERPAAVFSVTSNIFEGNYFVYTMGPNTYGVAVLAGALGTLEVNIEEAMSVLGSVRYSLALTETTERNGLSILYPTNWEVGTEDEGLIFANSAEALERSTLIEGDYGLALVPLAGLDITSTDIVGATTQLLPILVDENDEVSIPLVIDLGGLEVVSVDVRNPETDENEGGVFVMNTSAGLMAMIYITPKGLSYQLSLTALTMLTTVSVE